MKSCAASGKYPPRGAADGDRVPLVVRELVGRGVLDADGSVSQVQGVVQLPPVELDGDEVGGLAGVKHDEAVLLVRAELKPARRVE